ncbi:MAG TPA: helix-turn-helix transcriptional regulator [Bryobacteraceae bacterium]|jgi:DNA-binding NarL/FixJ family response regulator|nr:helix-turn-helix transcriptional regulator [Bryobacteraceae bacterium]
MNRDLSELSARKREILELLAQGKTSKEIATALQTAVETVATHRKAICRKLSLHSTAELVRYATIHWLAGTVFRSDNSTNL